jgi:hypothetical protein
MMQHPTLAELWQAAIGERIEAVFADERRGAYGAIEFVFAGGSVIKLTIEHLGLASYAAPIFPGEWVKRAPCDWPCIGRTITTIDLWCHPDHGVAQALRIGLDDGAISFRFDDMSVVLERPARAVDTVAERLQG